MVVGANSPPTLNKHREIQHLGMIFAARYLHVDLPTCQVNDFWRVKDGKLVPQSLLQVMLNLLNDESVGTFSDQPDL